MSEAPTIGNCRGCLEEGIPVQSRLVTLRDFPEEKPWPLVMCEDCWTAVTCADPETGAYGAAHIALKAAPTNEVTP